MRTIASVEALGALGVGSVVLNASRDIVARRLGGDRAAVVGNLMTCCWLDIWSPGSLIVLLYDSSEPVDAPRGSLRPWVPHPAWVTVALTPCATASCTDCFCGFGVDDDGISWHFDSPSELVDEIANDFPKYDPEDLKPWQVVGDALLCESCAAKRLCTASGHTLTEIRGHQVCTRCGHCEHFPERGIEVTP